MPSKPFRSSGFWKLLWCVNSNEELLLGREQVFKKLNLCNVESATRSFFTHSPWPHFFCSILISSEAAVCCYWSPVRHCVMSCGCDMTYCSNRRRAIWVWSIINMLMVAYFIPHTHISAETVINGLTRGVIYYRTINAFVPRFSVPIIECWRERARFKNMQTTVIFIYIWRPLFLFLSLETGQQSPSAITANTRQLLIYHSLNRWNSVQPSILNTRAQILSVSINHRAGMTEREGEILCIPSCLFKSVAQYVIWYTDTGAPITLPEG